MARGLHFDDTLGVILVGGMLTAVLFGITSLQIYLYYVRSKRDPRLLRGVIGVLWVMDGLHVILIIHTLYYYMVDNYLSPLALISPTWSFKVDLMVTHVTLFSVRGIFARRVWILSRGNWLLTSSVMVFAILVIIAGYGMAIRTFFMRTYADFHEVSWLIYTGLALEVATDLWIASWLCVLLNRSRSGFKKTDTMISTLMVYTINTGALTFVCAVGCFISYITMPTNFVFIGFYMLIPKLYLNALLATLNARDGLQEKVNSQPFIALSDISNLSGSGQQQSVTLPEKDGFHHQLSVNIETVTDVKSEPVEVLDIGHYPRPNHAFMSSYAV
ncbi:hypothetical protein BD410DRAFT_498972 [Rickenella mellea]|uniref:DUF6534 domain-containing protein n=1 Tax=Rickenella mellea TaxID=50990 RepID=A0A4Y7PTJ8_9AGAM|nr:hypothetical protein BD410DRAFT_498972 [Rickenella mellea]